MERAHRLTIRTLGADPRRAEAVRAARTSGVLDRFPELLPTNVADVVFVEGSLTAAHRDALVALLVDPILQTATWDLPEGPAIEVAPLAGVTDDTATAVLTACELLDIPAVAALGGRRIELAADGDGVDELAERVLSNPVVERWSLGVLDPGPLAVSGAVRRSVEVVPVRGLDDDALQVLDRSRGLSLDPAELRAVRDLFTSEGRDPTDAELETIAQTWSEHCAHKTFRARISTTDGVSIEPLLHQLRRCTESIDAPFVRSAFVGNAGLVSFVDGVALSMKAETHNHPSAVEPFGGANTGVGGVIRDVMGVGHRPIAVTDVLCFGPTDTTPDLVPAGSLHPERVRDGVVAGIADYGNKIGLPTVAGAVLYHPGYIANPLVFCGCLGIGADRPLPDRAAAGDRVVVLGGRTGRDGLRGATFSSATMDATTGDVAGASVQIGAPIVEKLLIDVLDGAEDLYRALTDCGAGGLSSAIGEMAEHLGAEIDLDVVPLKYPGLAPWEVWLSEAQERMVLAVAPEHVEALATRCLAAGVELTDVGSFTGTGRLVVRAGGEAVVDLRLDALHDGRPQRSMMAELPGPNRSAAGIAVPRVDDLSGTLLRLLAHPDIASKSDIVHRFDHEIRGATLLRPFTGVHDDGPSDGVVLAEPADDHGVAIGIGVAPWYGVHDPEAMAHAVIDEAIRNVVAAGADPARVALLDNFSWGDPRRPSTLGELVVAVRGCCDAAIAHGAPFVSGKDSLNNEFLGADGERHSVPPTLVITAVAHVPDLAAVPGTDLASAGDLLVLVGTTRAELGGSHLELLLDADTGARRTPGVVPQPDLAAPGRYRALHAAMRHGLVRACHDLSEGGLAVALAEMAIGGRLGATIDRLPTLPSDVPSADAPVVAWFSESSGRLLLEVAEADLDSFLDAMRAGRPAATPNIDVIDVDDVQVIGRVTDEPILVLPGGEPIAIDALVAAFQGTQP